MVTLKTERGVLSGAKIAIPGNIACTDRVTGSAQADVPAAGHLRRFTEVQRHLPATDAAAAVVGDRNIQLVAGSPDIRVRDRAGNSATTGRTAGR